MTMSVLMWGQAQINTKKVRIGDFTQKVTKIVLSGNDFQDAGFKDEIAARWRVTPYEFCTLSEFEQLKGNDNYYFLLTVKGQFRKEASPGLMFLTLVKGGEGAGKGIDSMLEVVSIPYAAADDPSGRELVFLPVIIDVIQTYAVDSMAKDINAYSGLAGYSKNIVKTAKMNIVFSEGDLSDEITDNLKERYFDDTFYATDEADADGLMTDNAENTVVSYVVAPSDPAPGSYCYKMLFGAENGQLYYYRKQRITKNAGAGFLHDDIIRIAAPRGK